jgi:hypothetical protein
MPRTSLFVVCVLLSGAAPEARADRQHAFAPLREGAQQTFRVRTRTPEGRFRSSTVRRQVLAVGRTPQGDLAATVRSSFSAAGRTSTTMHTEVVGPAGVHGAIAARQPGQVRLTDAQRRIVALPRHLSPGATWTEVNPRGADALTASRVVHRADGFATIKVNGRRMRALKVSSTETFTRGGQPFRSTAYYVEGLGVAKYVYRDLAGGVTVGKLRDYTPGK